MLFCQRLRSERRASALRLMLSPCQRFGSRSQAGVWLIFRRKDGSASCDPAAEKCA